MKMKNGYVFVHLSRIPVYYSDTGRINLFKLAPKKQVAAKFLKDESKLLEIDSAKFNRFMAGEVIVTSMSIGFNPAVVAA